MKTTLPLWSNGRNSCKTKLNPLPRKKFLVLFFLAFASMLMPFIAKADTPIPTSVVSSYDAALQRLTLTVSWTWGTTSTDKIVTAAAFADLNGDGIAPTHLDNPATYTSGGNPFPAGLSARDEFLGQLAISNIEGMANSGFYPQGDRTDDGIAAQNGFGPFDPRVLFPYGTAGAGTVGTSGTFKLTYNNVAINPTSICVVLYDVHTGNINNLSGGHSPRSANPGVNGDNSADDGNANGTVSCATSSNLQCAMDKTEGGCQTQAAIDASYNAWLASAVGTGCNGVLTNNSTGAPSASGGSKTVTFTYTQNGCPNQAAVTTCTATFTVLGCGSSSPVLNPDNNQTYVNVPVSGNVRTNDVNVPASSTYGTPVPVSGNPSGGTISMNADGTYTFTSTQIGVFKYNVPVCPVGQTTGCATSLLTITVLAEPTCPIGTVNLGNLTKYLFVFTDGTSKTNWQSSSKGYIGDVAVDGIQSNEQTSGTFPYKGTIYTNNTSLEDWQNIVNNNPGQAFSSVNQTTRLSGLESDLNSAFTQINALNVTPGYSSVSALSLNGLNTQNGIAETIVINVTSDFIIASKINITGDASDVFILRWDLDGNFADGYEGKVEFKSGGAIVPLGGLKASNFIHVAGDLAGGGGGTNPAAPYPQGPRTNNGTGTLINGSTDFDGGGFFTGYWLTKGKPSDLKTSSLSNAIFVGGWYTSSIETSLTSGSSGVYVAPPACNTTQPATNPDINVTYINVPVSGNVKTNDLVPAGTTYGTPVPVSGNPSGGSITMNADGTYTFVSPNVGVYKYNVPVCVPGQTAPCPTSLLTITVLGPNFNNNPPVANTDIASTNINTPVTINSLANDRAGNAGGSLNSGSVTVTVSPKNGTATVNPANGNITYTPATGFTGTDTLTYRVCDNSATPLCATAIQIITVNNTGSMNTTSAADDYAYTQINTIVTGNVKTNDTDAEGNTQTVTPQTTSTPAGTLTLTSSGSYTFAPTTGFTGPVSFVYTTCDNGTPSACASATLYVLVSPLQADLPSTNPDFNVTFVNVSVAGNVNTNDKVPAGSTYGTSPTLVSSPAGSTATLNMNSNGSYTFIANTVGVYTYDVPVCIPGQPAPCQTTKLVITVLSSTSNTNSPVANVDFATTNAMIPVTLKTLANDAAGNPSNSLVPSSVTVITAPLNGTTSVNPANGDITYTPNSGFSGSDTLTYQVCDNQSPAKCATAKQIITVKPAGASNTTAAADDYKMVPINTTATGNVKTNDSDAENNFQTVATQNTTVPGKGTLVLSADGSYTFTPVTGFTGPVEFIYTTCDNGVPQACASATLHILVKPVGDLPDLTPSIFNDGTTLIQGTTRDNVIRISNIGAGPTTAQFTFNILKMDPAFQVTINPTETSSAVFGVTPVSNSSFTIVEQATRFVVTSNPGVVIPAGGFIDLGVKVKAIGIKNSTGNLSVRIAFGTGGGETPVTNNSDNNTYSIN
ncbi:MAG: Ig-like domain-containing protein [Ferruginibacter sp.]